MTQVETTETSQSEQQAIKSKFVSSILKRQKSNGAADRRHKRNQCSCIGVMSILNRALTFQGVVTEVSVGGIKFRPAQTYLLDRKGTQILVEFADLKLTGRIVASRTDGYGIALFNELDDADLSQFLATYSVS